MDQKSCSCQKHAQRPYRITHQKEDTEVNFNVGMHSFLHKQQCQFKKEALCIVKAKHPTARNVSIENSVL